MNEARLSVCRTAMKIQNLQRRCHMDVMFIQHITAAFQPVGGANHLQDSRLNRNQVSRVLDRMFDAASAELSGHVTAEETAALMFRLFERNRSEQVSARSLQVALVALSADAVLEKYRGLVNLSGDGSGFITRSRLRSLLQDLSKVPTAVEEEEEDVFGSVEAAVSSCFHKGGAPAVSEAHLLSWLKSEPRLLLWLPALHRLSFSQRVSHQVRCHTCKTSPITGLRYRCKTCLNVHVCLQCFLTGQQSRKHKTHHPLVEFCTQPTWRESLSSFVQNARYALLPRRSTHRGANGRTVLKWEEPGPIQNRAPPSSDASSLLADSPHPTSSDGDVLHDASVQASPPPSSCKSLQTDEVMTSQQGDALQAEIRNLHRDKWLLEQQLGAWRLTVQSEQAVLEDRCSEMEATMETVRQQNHRLQDMLTQALRKMEAEQHANNTEHAAGGTATPSSDSLSSEEEEKLMKENWSPDELETPSPTMQHQPSPSPDEASDHQPIGQQGEPEGAGLQTNPTCLCEGEHHGMCSPEEQLQKIVDRLKMEEKWTEKTPGVVMKEELVEAALQVGTSVSDLVDAVKTD